MRGRTGLAPCIVVITLVALARVAEATLGVPGGAVDVGNVTVGDNATVNGTISTTSAAGETLDHLDKTGADCDRFTLTPGRTLPTLITLATPMGIDVRFDPTVRGLAQCTVTMRDNMNASLGSFIVRGTGRAQQASAAPPPSFGSLRVANAAVLTSTQDVTITNNGDAGFSLEIQALATTNDYAIVSPPTLPVTLAQNASLVVTVRFDPTVAGLRKGTLDIMSDDPVTALLSVELSGNGTAAQIAVDNPAFGIVTLQQTVTRTITVSNAITTDQGPLNVASAAISGGDGWFTFDTNGAFGCAGGTTCTLGASGTNVPPSLGVVVRCTPPAGASGMMSADVNFASDSDGGGDASSQITCIAGRADASVDPTTLAYADTRVGQTSAAKTVTVTNNGNQTLTFTAVPSGAQALAYVFSECAAASCTVAPNGGTKAFDVSFAPLADVQSNIAISIDSNDPDDASIPIIVTGKGIAPRITAPATVPFGNVEVPQTSAPLPLTVMNTGSATLTITNAVFGGVTPGAYAATSGTLGTQTTTVAPNGSTTWNLTCDPVQQGNNNATFVISSDALGTPTTTVNLTCNGTQGLLVVNAPSPPGAPSINFGGVSQGTSVTRAYTLRNSGNLAVSSIAGVLNNGTLGYSLDPTTPVPPTLNPGQQVSLNVIFAPQSGSAGGPANVAFTGTFGAVPTATNATLSLDGDGLTAGFDVTPPALAFGDVRFDQTRALTFCIVNTDQTPVIIQNPIAIAPDVATTMTGEFTVSRIRRQDVCGTAGTDVALPQTLTPGQPNQILEITILAAPANRTGVMAATVTVTSNLAMNPTRTVALTGTATSGVLTLTPGATVDFGGVDLQGPPAQRTLSIRNTGDGAVDLSSFARTPNNPNFTFTLPAGTTTLQPNQQVDIAITYQPVVAAPVGSEEQFTITHATAGALGAPPLAMILVQGRGIDRVFTVVETPAFPDTFRNPGSAAPVRPVRVMNTGEATLVVSAVMVTNDPQVWQLVNANPIEIPGGGSVDFPVRFAPVAAGRAEAFLELTHDAFDPPMTGPTTTTRIELTGIGLARNVLFAPTDIDLGFTGIGIPVSLADALTVTSMDTANTFTIKEIALDDAAGVFSIDDAPVGLELAPSQTQSYRLTFTPNVEGDFTATASLLLDDDPTPQATITIRGRAVFVDARGGGGCSTHGGAGLLPIALAALALRRRRRSALAALAVVAALAIPAHADNVALSTFDPTPATSTSGFQLQNADVGGVGEWAAFALLSHAADPLVLDAFVNGQFINADRVVSRSTMIQLGGAYAFLDRFEAGLRMPLYMQGGDALGDPMTMFTTEPASGTARGDLTLHAKARFLKQKLGAGGISVAGAFAVTLPTATDGAFTGNDTPSARVLGLGTYVPGVLDGRLTVNGNLGFVLRKTAQFANLEQKSGFAFGAGASLRVLERLWVAAEVFGDASIGGRARSSGNTAVLAPTELLGGVRLRLDRTLDLGVAVGRGVTTAAGSPALRGVLQLSFTPNAAEPKPLGGRIARADVDSDGDGIFDRVDKCPNEVEDTDLFEDWDGCPEPDNDKDGVLDAADRCPLDAEDKDGFDDGDGCPDRDNDGDLILDAQDKCPNEPEDRDAFKDDDGCPDPDNDGDGIVDGQDKCPLEPETINGNKDDDGCPDAGDSAVVLSPDRLELLDPIQFRGAKFERSFNVLGQVGSMLRAHPEILRLRISVHLHPTGNDRADQELSDKRAAALKEWLVQWGIADARLEARGFGSEQLAVPKDRPGAAGMNDRVELIILEKK